MQWNMRVSTFEALAYLTNKLNEVKPNIVLHQETRKNRIFLEDFDRYTPQPNFSDGQHCTETLVSLRVIEITDSLPLCLDLQLKNLDIYVHSIYFSTHLEKYKQSLKEGILKRFQKQRSIIEGDFNYLKETIHQTYHTSRIDQLSSSEIDFYSNKQIFISTSGYLLILKEFKVQAERYGELCTIKYKAGKFQPQRELVQPIKSPLKYKTASNQRQQTIQNQQNKSSRHGPRMISKKSTL